MTFKYVGKPLPVIQLILGSHVLATQDLFKEKSKHLYTYKSNTNNLCYLRMFDLF